MKKFLSVGVLVWMVLAVVSHALLDTSSLHEAGVVLGGVAGVLTPNPAIDVGGWSRCVA